MRIIYEVESGFLVHAAADDAAQAEPPPGCAAIIKAATFADLEGKRVDPATGELVPVDYLGVSPTVLVADVPNGVRVRKKDGATGADMTSPEDDELVQVEFAPADGELGVERATSGQMQVSPLEGQLVNGELVLTVTPPAGMGQEDLVFRCPGAPAVRGARVTFSWE